MHPASHCLLVALQPGKAGIQDTLDYYLGQGGVPAEKLSLGLVPYARTWTLSANRSMEAGATGLGAAASGPGIPSICPGEDGRLHGVLLGSRLAALEQNKVATLDG